MQSLINFIVRYKEFITFTALAVISLSIISISNVSQIGGFRTVVIAFIGVTQEAFAWIPNPGALKNENDALRELNLELSREVTRMRTAQVENLRLRDMLEFSVKSEKDIIPAEIVGKSVVDMRNYVTIDKGSRDSIQRGMPVRTDAGLVGIVMGSSQNYSLVETISNRNIRIAAKVDRTLIDGIVVWEGGEDFLLKNIPSSFDVQVGDRVSTSNFSNRFPELIPIGQVTEISEEQGSLFYDIKIKPFVNFKTIEQVFVIKTLPDPERLELIDKLQKEINAGNN